MRYWMHTGFLNVKGEKMSESLGNFTIIRDMLQNYEPAAFRFFVLLAHYRSPIDFSEEVLEQAPKSLKRVRLAAKIIEEQLETSPAFFAPEQMDFSIDPGVAEAKARLLESMDNDFNMPYARRAIFDLVREVNRRINEKTISQKGPQDASELLRVFGEVLGLSFYAVGKKLAERAEAVTDNLIELLIVMRFEPG